MNPEPIPQKNKKTELCRFYLRGLCVNSSKDCFYGHGVWDLFYEPWTEGETVVYDYSKVEKENKESIIKGPRNYVNLYDYQRDKIFTLQEINTEKQKKNMIRNQMHMEMYNDFMDLLSCYYPNAIFTQDFLLREFTRVGFNKQMSIIKMSHICGFVCDPHSSRFFKASLILPPFTNKETVCILPSLTEEENLSFYRGCFEDFLEQNKGELNENLIKKYLFSVVRPSMSILPLNIYLKNKKMNFSNFLKLITNGQSNVPQQVNEKVLLSSATNFVLAKTLQENSCTWNEVYKHLAEQHKLNNANVINPLKPHLISEGFTFLNFPMVQFITTEQRLNAWDFPLLNGCQSICQCNMKTPYSDEQTMMSLMNFQQELQEKVSFDIYDTVTLLQCASAILKSQILGVDIEGRLRKNGYIEMIQINTGKNTFLIDIHRILINNDIETFNLCKKVLRNAFTNPKIIKIFHDCRHDSLVLHEVMNTCVVNIFDTSAVETYISQMQIYKKELPNKQILKTITNVKTPGLNEILKKYSAPHGLNKNKQWFHELWKKGHTQLFEQRPLHPEYRDYCIRDVLDLLYLQKQMGKQLDENFTNWLSSHYVRAGYLYMIES